MTQVPDPCKPTGRCGAQPRPGASLRLTALAGRCGVEFDLASLPRSLERHGLRAG